MYEYYGLPDYNHWLSKFAHFHTSYHFVVNQTPPVENHQQGHMHMSGIERFLHHVFRLLSSWIQ